MSSQDEKIGGATNLGDAPSNHQQEEELRASHSPTTLSESLISSLTASEAKDLEGIALLRQIFPELSISELHQLHNNNVHKSARKKKGTQSPPQPTSPLGKRIWRQSRWLDQHSSTEDPFCWRPVELPDDFLTLPASVAVRRFNENSGKWYYLLVERLEEQVIEQHQAYREYSGRKIADHLVVSKEVCYSRVIFRDAKSGLGMTLCEEGGRVWVHSLVDRDGVRWFTKPTESETGGPALEAGVAPGDWLIGVNGQALVLPQTGPKTLLREAVSSIQFSEDPIVLHLRRVPTDESHPLVCKNGDLKSVPVNSSSPLDTLMQSTETTKDDDITDETLPAIESRIHPFVQELKGKGLVNDIEEQVRCTQRLKQFTDRARQWESFSSFRLDARTYELSPAFDPINLPPSLCSETLPFENPTGENIRPYAPSTPPLDPACDYIPPLYFGVSAEEPPDAPVESAGLISGVPIDLNQRLFKQDSKRTFPGQRQRSHLRRSIEDVISSSDVFIPLIGVRKALCVRIVNHFMDEEQTAYTIWVFDVEAGREWYAPVRYLRDFHELRTASLPLCPSLSQLPFPQQSWGVFAKREKRDSDAVREAKCRQLEYFLRRLASLLYTEKLHPVISEISVHLQSFLGCDVCDSSLRLQPLITLNEAMVWQMPEPFHSGTQMKTRLLLKRSIQRYVYRLFLLEEVERLVTEFVDAMKSLAPKLWEIEVIESKGRNKLKERAIEDLERIQSFLDQMQNTVIEGCRLDLHAIAQRRDFAALKPFMHGFQGEAYLDRIFREAVREQVEIEVYVPLRGLVSRLLVNGWRHDDMEIHFKINELRLRPQASFRIPPEKESPTGWSSVSSVLNQGVGMSTLPCAKLRAIVDAAKEITRVYEEDRRSCDDERNSGAPGAELGADDFLPIFIYCVVQAEMERPCALCVLLRTLCEPTNRIGEIGYYLASFEAAITHIQEVNLAEDRD